MGPEKIIERLEVMRDCYEMFFGGNDSAGFEAKYRENREAFDYAVNLIKNIPEGAVLIDARKLRADLQLYFNEAILQGVTPETMFRQILSEIDVSDFPTGYYEVYSVEYITKTVRVKENET